ncbi:EamA family transporter [Nocardioides limicola]|uniref:EamA family transporter n=1 Tax=Nocardioides limicola TaxID=2803368 RepID=UPI00193C045F|nr:EamA family transporter [Nocardioides sp. DJM-14]
MPRRHRLLAVTVAVIWGLNFLAIDASLGHFPPMFLVSLRFTVIAIPTLLLVPLPSVPLRWLIGYGIGFGTLQFLFLYAGMYAGMPPGLASLVLQSSAPFTVLLGAALFADRISRRQLLGLVLACGGLAIVGWSHGSTAAITPFLLVLAGGFGWAIGNLCNTRIRSSEPLHVVLWMSVVPPLPMLAIALAVEGPTRITASLTSWQAPTAVPAVLGLGYTVLVGTLLGSGIWTWLLSRHPAGQVAPFSMLVPVVGMSSAWLVLGETLSTGEWIGAVVVVGGVLLGSSGVRARGAGRSRRAGSRPAPSQPVGQGVGQRVGQGVGQRVGQGVSQRAGP